MFATVINIDKTPLKHVQAHNIVQLVYRKHIQYSNKTQQLVLLSIKQHFQQNKLCGIH